MKALKRRGFTNQVYIRTRAWGVAGLAGIWEIGLGFVRA